MKSVVILCRHGNTFAKGEKVVMVGANEDLALTEEGIAQARAVGAALVEAGPVITSIIAGPLKRTRVFAEELIKIAAPALTYSVDDRLRELDYGAWGGLSNDEISALSGTEALRRWQQDGERPQGVTFMPAASELEQQTRDLLNELAAGGGLSVVVTSNGRLREFGRIVGAGNKSGQDSCKVNTGASCVLLFDGNSWSTVCWNVGPPLLAAISFTDLSFI